MGNGLGHHVWTLELISFYQNSSRIVVFLKWSCLDESKPSRKKHRESGVWSWIRLCLVQKFRMQGLQEFATTWCSTVWSWNMVYFRRPTFLFTSMASQKNHLPTLSPLVPKKNTHRCRAFTPIGAHANFPSDPNDGDPSSRRCSAGWTKPQGVVREVAWKNPRFLRGRSSS